MIKLPNNHARNTFFDTFYKRLLVNSIKFELKLILCKEVFLLSCLFFYFLP